MNNKIHVDAFFDPATSTFSYLVYDDESLCAAIIDSVLDYDPKSGRTKTDSADRILHRVKELQLNIVWHLETHVHADHLSAAVYLQKQLGGKLVIGSEIVHVQQVFGTIFNLGNEFVRDGSQFDYLLKDGDSIAIGQFMLRALHTPGHTPACMTYLIEDSECIHAFVGDTLFMPDYGTARCDFPGGSAETLFGSIQKVLSLPDNTKLYMCHDYPPNGRTEQFLCTVKAQREDNVHVHEGINQHAFVSMRQARDATLSMPVLLLPAVQVNMRAGHFPPTENNAISYLKIPLNAL
jgi:glyoxylase-like metal-dependent hydrolase (beta-lactamase superfamily II)